MTEVLTVLAAVSLAAWLYLIFLRGGFWRADQRLGAPAKAPAAWPEIAAVVPARNEATVIGRSLRALLAQDYPGALSVVVVDDESDDGTADAARAAASESGRGARVTVVRAAPRPTEWIGKTWALAQGIDRVEAIASEARYLWLTDADIVHEPRVLRELVAKAEAERLDLVSLLALLDCETRWGRFLFPAFVFFFRKLYPFRWVNDPKRKTAGAAGGCMLLRRSALARAGGMGAIKNALIDDCALAGAIKPGGAIWLGLATATRSIRPYAGLSGLWNMVARFAFAQLRHSPGLLAGTVLGMLVVYLGPPIAAIAGSLSGAAPAAALGLAGWLLMAGAYASTLRLYQRPLPAAVLLPAAALLFTLMTIGSARRHWRGMGGDWKGRTYAPSPRSGEGRLSAPPTKGSPHAVTPLTGSTTSTTGKSTSVSAMWSK